MTKRGRQTGGCFCSVRCFSNQGTREKGKRKGRGRKRVEAVPPKKVDAACAMRTEVRPAAAVAKVVGQGSLCREKVKRRQINFQSE